MRHLLSCFALLLTLLSATSCSRDADLDEAPGSIIGVWRQTAYHTTTTAPNGTVLTDRAGVITRPGYPMGYTFSGTKVTAHSDALPEPQGLYARAGNQIHFDFPQTEHYEAVSYQKQITTLTPGHLTLRYAATHPDGSTTTSVDDYERQ